MRIQLCDFGLHSSTKALTGEEECCSIVARIIDLATGGRREVNTSRRDVDVDVDGRRC